MNQPKMPLGVPTNAYGGVQRRTPLSVRNYCRFCGTELFEGSCKKCKTRLVKTEGVRELEQLGITNISYDRLDDFRVAKAVLIRGELLDFCVGLVNDYHAGDTKLATLMLRGALRVLFSSNSALINIGTTGKAGGGKNDLIENVLELLPKSHVVCYSSITSKNLFYEMFEDRPGMKKKVMNPDHFRNKIIAVTEIADSKGYSALKAFSELNERTKARHKATNKDTMEIRGPRGIWVASVSGVKSTQEDQAQVNRRFINNILEADTPEKRQVKVDVVTDTLVNQRNIANDDRFKIAKAGFELLFASNPIFEPPTNEVAQMVMDLNHMLERNGHDPSRWKQVYALAECAAVEKQFQRRYVRVEEQDVLEAWFLSGFSIRESVLLNGEWRTAAMGPVICVEKVEEAEEAPYDSMLPFDDPEAESEDVFRELVKEEGEWNIKDDVKWGSWRYENKERGNG